MFTKALLLGLCALTGLANAHGDHHHEEEDTQKPFIGWTREDLDAKWGTDVSPTSTVHVNAILTLNAVGLQWHLNLRPS